MLLPAQTARENFSLQTAVTPIVQMAPMLAGLAAAASSCSCWSLDSTVAVLEEEGRNSLHTIILDS